MKIFGSFSELVSLIFRKNSQAITLRPNQATTYTGSRDIQTPAQDANSVLVSRDSTDTLTNKSVSGASNTITNVSLTTGVTGILPAANGGTGQNSTATFPTSGVVVTEAASETLSNKTLNNTNTITVKDTLLTIQDDGDTSKQAKFQASGITTGTTRTLTIPDADITLVGTGATQPLTNKTLDNTNTVTLKDTLFTLQDDADVTKQFRINVGSITTGITRQWDVPDVNSTFVGTAASQSIQNKTLDNTNVITVKDANLTIQDDADTTKQAKFQASGITTGTTRTFTLPDADITLVGTDATQTLTNKTLDAPVVTSGATVRGDVLLQNTSGGQPSLQLSEATVNGTNKINVKAPAALAADYTLTLPVDDGNANEVLQTDGSGVLAWAAVATASLAQFNVNVGDSGGTQRATNTSLLGNIKGETGSGTATVTIATPAVVTLSAHGRVTGSKVYFTTTGALPTGLSASTTYYVVAIDANTFSLATTLANAAAGTKIATTGSQSGTHTLFYGGLTVPSPGLPGVVDASAATSGYIGQRITAAEITGVNAINGSYVQVTTLTLTPGDWNIDCMGTCSLAGGNTIIVTFAATSASETGASLGLTKTLGAVNAGVGGGSLCFTLNITTATPYFLNILVNSTGSLYGSIRATRVR